MSVPQIHNDAALIESLGLSWTHEQRNQYLHDIPTIHLQRLTPSYPSINKWMTETDAAEHHWRQQWQAPLKDNRPNKGQRRAFERLDRTRLQHIVKPTDSVQIVDRDTGETVMLVLRHVVSDLELLHTMTQLCKEATLTRRDSRRDDPGKLVHIGYTAGPQNKKMLTLARTIQGTRPELNRELQGMCSVVWNIARSRLPLHISQDFTTVINQNGLPRMDMDMEMDMNVDMKPNNKPTYGITTNRTNYTFDVGELAPPCALAASNYARYTHHESNATKWMIAMTCHVSTNTNTNTSTNTSHPEQGGNFFVASYGVLMEAASNTLSAWRPRDDHGTTLYEVYDGRENCGVGFEIPVSLKVARENRDRFLLLEGGGGEDSEVRCQRDE